MITVPAGVRIHLALGPTDMRKGFDGLALQVQEVLRADPFSGHLFMATACASSPSASIRAPSLGRRRSRVRMAPRP